MRKVNNVVALIPEWEYDKLNLKAFRNKIGNGYIVNPKDLKSSSDEFFSLEVFKMGGMVLSMVEAEALLINPPKDNIFQDIQKGDK